MPRWVVLRAASSRARPSGTYHSPGKELPSATPTLRLPLQVVPHGEKAAEMGAALLLRSRLSERPHRRLLGRVARRAENPDEMGHSRPEKMGGERVALEIGPDLREPTLQPQGHHVRPARVDLPGDA